MSYYHHLIKSAVVPALLLDTYSGAVVAYSLRKLSNTYMGNCIRVRRSSDNTEQDFGFSSGVLDTASLLTFCGAGSGFLVTWYDQSGNGKNAVQSSAAVQNRIVRLGSLITMTGKSLPIIKNPAAEGSSGGIYNLYTYSSPFVLPTVWTYTYVYDCTNLTTEYVGIGGSTYNTPYCTLANSILVSDSSNYFIKSTTLTTGNKLGSTYRKSNTNVGILINNTSIGTENALPVANSTPLHLMNRANNSPNNTMAECILWNVDYSSDISVINNSINTYYGIY
jgi:hypothetical protein